MLALQGGGGGGGGGRRGEEGGGGRRGRRERGEEGRRGGGRREEGGEGGGGGGGGGRKEEVRRDSVYSDILSHNEDSLISESHILSGARMIRLVNTYSSSWLSIWSLPTLMLTVT